MDAAGMLLQSQVTLIIFLLSVTGFRGGELCYESWLLNLPNSLFFFSCPVWTGASVQPWGAALLSCLLVCSRLCCCLRSALASNGCKYSHGGHHPLLQPAVPCFPYKQCQNTRRHYAATASLLCVCRMSVYVCVCVCGVEGAWQLWKGPPTFLELPLMREEAVCWVYVYLMKGAED